MPEKKNQQDEDQERAPAPETTSPKPLREVTVTHLDFPPPSGKRNIHPRRPAPIVPSREQRTEEDEAKGTEGDETSRE
jgi:hypothetical protein